MDDPSLSLDVRRELPDALRVLMAAFPRQNWEAHPNFGELVRFWMSRHVMFRDVLDRMTDDLNGVLWWGIDPVVYKSRLGRLGQFMLQELHAHHNIEDHHYFPQLIGLEPKIDHGFALLESDHTTIDGMLAEFAEVANKALSPGSGRDELGQLQPILAAMTRDLDRHLTDEEDLIVPVILKSGFSG